MKFYSPYPVYAKKAKGSHLWDLDGNEYIDYMLCLGPLFVGHAHPKVVEAIRKQLESDGSQTFGAPHELEMRMAERLKRIFPFADLARFTNSGLEATLHSLRIAKGYSKKSRIAKFEGAYHGSYDEVLVSLAPAVDSAGPEYAPQGVSGSFGTADSIVKNVQVLPYNDIENTVKILRANKDELAAVIMEPVQRGFVVPDVEFLKAVREVTSDLGVLLIFDEVMSGFTGRVRDTSGGGLQGCRVHNGRVDYFPWDRPDFFAASSDSSGAYTLVCSNSATYFPGAFLYGFRLVTPAPGTAVVLPASGSATLDFVMEPIARVSVNASTNAAEEGRSDEGFVFTRSGPVEQPLEVWFQRGGTAGPEDFGGELTAGRVTIPSGTNTLFVPVTLRADLAIFSLHPGSGPVHSG